MSQIEKAIQKKKEEEELRRLEEEKRERLRPRQGAIPKRRSGDEGNMTDTPEREVGGSDRDPMSRRDVIDYYNSLNIHGYENATHDDIIRVFTDIQTDEKDMSDVNEWKQRLEGLLSDRAVRQIRDLDIPGPFVQQIHHMLNLCGLSIRQWNEISPTVLFDSSPESETLIRKMIYAVRYIGFDPAALLKKMIRYHREGSRQPKIVFQIEVDQDGELVMLSFSNLESFYHDMTFLILLFLQRGAVISKISKKSSRDFTSVMKMLIAKYNVRADDEGQRRRRVEPLGPEVITLPTRSISTG